MNERPIPSDYDPFYETYIQFVPEGDLEQLMELQAVQFRELVKQVPDKQTVVLHQPYTWTLKQLVGHLIDAEKVFGCRAHRFACGDSQPLPGMEQNEYVNGLDYESVSFSSLVDEWEHLRRSNALFLRRLSPVDFSKRGNADGKSITVLALACIMYGHVAYHVDIIHQRLGIAPPQ